VGPSVRLALAGFEVQTVNLLTWSVVSGGVWPITKYLLNPGEYHTLLPDKILTSTSRKPNYRRHLESILFNNMGQTPPLTTLVNTSTTLLVLLVKMKECINDSSTCTTS